MLAAAQRRAEPKGITNVRFRQMDMNVPLDQPAASVDGVLGRWAYMLVNDGEAALRETRRILKPDAEVALAAWTGPDDNLWSAAPVQNPASARAPSSPTRQDRGSSTGPPLT